MKKNIEMFMAEVERGEKKHPGPFSLRQWYHHLLSEWHEALAEEPHSEAMYRELTHVAVVAYRMWLNKNEYSTKYFVQLCHKNNYSEWICPGSIIGKMNTYWQSPTWFQDIKFQMRSHIWSPEDEYYSLALQLAVYLYQTIYKPDIKKNYNIR